MEKTTEVERCCFCGSEDLRASGGRGLRERLLLGLSGLDGFRCGSCKRRFAASALRSRRGRHRKRRRLSLEERLEPTAKNSTPRWVLAVAIVVTTVAVLGGLIWAERGFAPFSTLRASPATKAAP